MRGTEVFSDLRLRRVAIVKAFMFAVKRSSKVMDTYGRIKYVRGKQDPFNKGRNLVAKKNRNSYQTNESRNVYNE